MLMAIFSTVTCAFHDSDWHKNIQATIKDGWIGKKPIADSSQSILNENQVISQKVLNISKRTLSLITVRS